MPQYCHIGEVRPGAGIAWVRVTWGEGNLPLISFFARKEPHHKVLLSIVPQAIEALLAQGSVNLIIEEAL